jgi:hypothetical protein
VNRSLNGSQPTLKVHNLRARTLRICSWTVVIFNL